MPISMTTPMSEMKQAKNLSTQSTADMTQYSDHSPRSVYSGVLLDDEETLVGYCKPNKKTPPKKKKEAAKKVSSICDIMLDAIAESIVETGSDVPQLLAEYQDWQEEVELKAAVKKLRKVSCYDYRMLRFRRPDLFNDQHKPLIF